MALIKIQRFFGAVPNELLNNPDISFKAKGLYAYLNSKPDNWDFSVEGISAQVKEGIDSVRGGIHELEKTGYLKRIKHQNEKGFWEIDYMLFENPTEGESSLGKSEEGKHPKQYKKEYTNKEYTNNNNTGDDSNSSPTNQVKDNPDEIKKGAAAAPAAKKASVQEVKEALKEKMGEYKDKYPREMLNEFFLYWTESSQTKKDRLRYQDEKYFDVGRRLATWNKNATKNKFGEPAQQVKPNSNIKFNIQ
jgi:hypothetical protein